MSSKLKCLQMIGRYARRTGSEQLAVDLAQRLPRFDIESRFALLEPFQFDGLTLAEEQLGPVMCLPKVPWRKRTLLLDGVWTLRRLLQRQRIDIVHSHDIASNIICSLATFGITTKWVASRYGYLDYSFKFRVMGRVDTCVLRRARRIFVASAAARATLMGIDANRIVDVDTGIRAISPCATAGSASLRSKFLSRSDGSPYRDLVLVLGRLAVEKGHDILLDALANHRDWFVDAKFVIVGDGPLKDVLEKRISALGLTSQVELTGFFDADVDDLYRACDLFVQPSRSESLPLTVLEAMSCRRAVVATAVGGVEQLLGGGANGWLVEPQNSQALAVAMRDALAQDELREVKAKCAQAHVLEKYSLDANVERMAAIYRDVAAGARG